MPIKPENRHRYPADWQEIRTRILERANHCCERCLKPNGATVDVLPGGYWYDWDADGPHGSGGWRNNCGQRVNAEDLTDLRAVFYAEDPRSTRVVLTIAHWPDPTPENCAEENLWALCQACHLRIDMDVHLAHRRETLRARRNLNQPSLALI